MSELRQDRFNLSCFYKVTIDSLEVAHFRSASGLDVSIDMVDYQEGGLNTYTHKLRGPTRWSNIVLSQGSCADNAFYEWIKECIDGTISRKSGSIIALAHNLTDIIAEWKFIDAFPVRYRGPTFNSALQSEVAIEELELAHHGFERVKG